MEWKNRVKEEIQGEIINTVSYFLQKHMESCYCIPKIYTYKKGI